MMLSIFCVLPVGVQVSGEVLTAVVTFDRVDDSLRRYWSCGPNREEVRNQDAIRDLQYDEVTYRDLRD